MAMRRQLLPGSLTAAMLLACIAAPASRTQSPQTQSRQTAAPSVAGPRLVVFIVIDQFRADYVDLYGRQWTKGLRRLLDNGAVFSRAAFPYAATYTCAGHATISTGAFPAVHGMAGNTFYDRSLRRALPCAFDPDVTSVPFGGVTGRERHGPRAVLVPTFTDELRRQSAAPTRVVSIGQKPRTAVTLAGRGHADTIAVWEEDDGTWATSSAYTRTPWPEVDAFVRANPMKAAYGAVWTPIIAPGALRFVDDGAGEGRPAPWSRTFPHPLVSASGQPDNQFVTAWERSPWDDAFLTDLAIHLLGARKLGTGPATDVLTLSLPSLDHTGHEYGPRSHEVQDVLARLDVNVGRLLDAIEAQVGRHYVLGMSSDHGVALIPEQVAAEGGNAGRISTTAVRNAINAAVEKVLGVPGPHVASIYEEQVALTPGLVDVLRTRRGGLQAVTDAIRGVTGVAAAYAADDLISASATTNEDLRAWRLSYVPGRSGDFVFIPRVNWIARGASGSTHGSRHAYDQRVPLVLYGSSIRPGQYTAPSTPADLAPTFAMLTGIRMPRAQGRALTEALVR
jgi:predicted AlkP superfamily pyrophosphatase or phosphodiesterase